jgi:eukaryotic-like serine/threonine-protein kinase
VISTDHRGNLDEYEAQLLRACEPRSYTPPDPAETIRRLQAMVRSGSGADTEIRLVFEHVRARDPNAAVEPARIAVERLPNSARAAYALALALRTSGRSLEVESAYRRCIELSPRASECLVDLGYFEMTRGQCKKAESTLRRACAAAPSEFAPFLQLMRALHGGEADESAISTAIDLAAARKVPSRQALFREQIGNRLALARGHFDKALQHITAWERMISENNSEDEHGWPVEWRVQILAERGQREEARKVADAFLKQHAGFVRDRGVDTRLFVLAARHRADESDDRSFEPMRDALLASLPDGAPVLETWLTAYALPAFTAEEASFAVAKMPVNLQPDVLAPLEQESVARVLALAGQPERAMPFLEQATERCLSLHAPMQFVRAQLLRGELLQAKGDLGGACAAFASVLSAWGSEPRSVTVEKARRHRAALACVDNANDFERQRRAGR